MTTEHRSLIFLRIHRARPTFAMLLKPTSSRHIKQKSQVLKFRVARH
jgi:hypothetical protein